MWGIFKISLKGEQISMSRLSHEQRIRVQYDFYKLVYKELLKYMNERNIQSTTDLGRDIFRIKNTKDKEEKKNKINILKIAKEAIDKNADIYRTAYDFSDTGRKDYICIKLLIQNYPQIIRPRKEKDGTDGTITEEAIRRRFNSFTQNKKRPELHNAVAELLEITPGILMGFHSEITIAFAEKAYYYSYDSYLNDEYYDTVTEQEEMLWLEEFYADYQKFNKKEKIFIWYHINELTVNFANLYDILENLELLNKKGRSAFYTYLDITFPTKFRKLKYQNTSINSNYNTFVALLESFNAVTAKKLPTKEMIFRKLKPFAPVKYDYIVANTVLISTKDELLLEVFKLLTVLSDKEYSMFKVFLNHLQSISEYQSQKNRL